MFLVGCPTQIPFPLDTPFVINSTNRRNTLDVRSTATNMFDIIYPGGNKNIYKKIYFSPDVRQIRNKRVTISTFQ